MTLDPLLPLPLLVPAALLFVAACVLCLVRERERRLAWGLRAGVALALSFALLRPGTEVSVGSTQVAASADVFILADTSASAAAEDWDGERPRLEGIREDIGAIVDAVPGARYSLITFDSTAEPRMPLTTDDAAMRTAAEVMQPEIGSYSGGTSIGVASGLLSERLEAAAAERPDSARLVFYLGDGEQTATGEPESFRDCAALVTGGAVFGYGTAGGGRMRENPGPYAMGGADYIRDRDSGEPARSFIDEERLEAVAQQLGVGYEKRAAGRAPSIEVAFGTEATGEGKDVVGRSEATWLALGAAFVLLVADLVLATRQWRLLAGPRR